MWETQFFSNFGRIISNQYPLGSAQSWLHNFMVLSLSSKEYLPTSYSSQRGHTSIVLHVLLLKKVAGDHLAVAELPAVLQELDNEPHEQELILEFGKMFYFASKKLGSATTGIHRWTLLTL